MIGSRRLPLLMTVACTFVCWPITARDSAAAATSDNSSKLIDMMLDCAMRPTGAAWLSHDPALYSDGFLRFSYLRERPRKLRDPNNQDGDPRFGWPNEDLLYVAFWKQSTGTKKTGTLLLIGLSDLSTDTLDWGEYARIVSTNGKLDYDDPPGGIWTNEAIWFRVEWLEHAPIHTFAIRDIPRTHAICEGP